MNIRILSGCVTGLCLLATTAMGGPATKGIVNTLDLKTGDISIDYEEMRITGKTRIRTAGGSTRDADDLAVRQHVSYSVDKLGNVTEIRIYDPRKLIEQGFYTSDEMEE